MLYVMKFQMRFECQSGVVNKRGAESLAGKATHLSKIWFAKLPLVLVSSAYNQDPDIGDTQEAVEPLSHIGGAFVASANQT